MKVPTTAVWDFLGGLHANSELARRLLREMTEVDQSPEYRGLGLFIVELDGEPCMTEARFPVVEKTYEQGVLL